MKEKELRSLSRADLLQMLIEQSMKMEELQARLDDAEARLADRRIAISESGSLAEAALALNGVFEAAQRACDQYTENIKLRSPAAATQELRKAAAQLQEMRRRCQEQEQQTRIRCEQMVMQARKQSQAHWEETRKKLDAYYDDHAGLRELLALTNQWNQTD